MLQCPVCLEGLGESPHTLQCEHQFHGACLVDWFRRGHAECPICRDVPTAYLLDQPPETESLGIVTESTLNDVAESLDARRGELDGSTVELLGRFFRVRARLRRLRACSSFLRVTTTRTSRGGVLTLRKQRCQNYAAEALYYEEELSELGAELVALTQEDDEASSHDAAASSDTSED